MSRFSASHRPALCAIANEGVSRPCGNGASPRREAVSRAWGAAYQVEVVCDIDGDRNKAKAGPAGEHSRIGFAGTLRWGLGFFGAI
jgi:hypothetical protein